MADQIYLTIDGEEHIMGQSTQEGIKSFYKHYKRANVKTFSRFFGVSEQMAYKLLSAAKTNAKRAKDSERKEA